MKIKTFLIVPTNIHTIDVTNIPARKLGPKFALTIEYKFTLPLYLVPIYRMQTVMNPYLNHQTVHFPSTSLTTILEEGFHN